MAQRYRITGTVQQTGGASVRYVPNASVQVKDLQGNNLTVYTTETGSTTTSNPLTADAAGRSDGWVEAPDFDLAISGTGVTPYTINVRQSPAGTFNVKSYGAVGNGTTDDTAAIQAAITAARAANGVCLVPQGTFRVTGHLTDAASTARVFVQGAGVGLTVLQIEVSGTEMLGGSFGSLGSTVAITSGSALGATQLMINSTTGLAAGDFIVVRDTTQTILGNSDKTAAGVAGEIARIKSVDSSTQITLRGRLDFAYTTSGDIRKLTYLDGFEVRDLTVKNPNPGTGVSAANRAIAVSYARNVRLLNIDFQDLDASAIRLAKVWDWDVTGCKFRDIRDTETANNPYCVHLAEIVENGIMANCWGRYGRHLFTAGGGTVTEPQPAHNLIADSIGTNFSQATFDTHPGARFHEFVNCHAHNGLAYGFQIRGPDSSVINPTVSQQTTGVVFINGADRGQLRGGRISGCDVGVTVDESNDCSLTGTRIYNPVTNGVLVQESGGAWAGYTTDLEIDDIKVSGNPSTAAFNFSVWNDRFRIGRIYAPDATTKTTGNVNVPTVYGLYNDGFAGGVAPSVAAAGSASITMVANRAVLVRFVPQRNMTISNIAFVVTTAAGADDAVDVGIYGPPSGGTLTRLVSKGATTGLLNTTGVKTVAVTATRLVGGTVYYIALSCGTLGGTAAVLAGAGFGDTNSNQIMGTAAPNLVGAIKSTSHPLPSTISGPSSTSAGVRLGVLE